VAKPLQVYLDDQDFRRLERWTRERRWTLSQAVRTAVRALTRERDEDPLLSMSGMIDGLPVDGAERFAAYLDATYVAERPAPYGKGRRRGGGRTVRR
jgi:hypothetical protein